MKTVKLSNNVSFITKRPHYHVGDHVGDHDESIIQNCRGFGEEQLPGLPRVSHVAGQLAHQELGQVLCSESCQLWVETRKQNTLPMVAIIYIAGKC